MEEVKNGAKLIFMTSKEAESVKLFSNTYLAMRVAYVNELSNFAAKNKINTNRILEGVGLDKRIGSHYFRPSTGFGGYCLPKDSKQLISEFGNRKIENKLFDAIVKSNDLRINSLVELAIEQNIKKIAINGIGHKPGVINQRNSTKIQIAIELKKHGIDVIFIDKNGVIDGFKVLDKKPSEFTFLKELF